VRDRRTNLLVGGQTDVTILVTVKPDRKTQSQLTALRFVLKTATES
jgi:hypothetical protein